ncbi:MAG: type IV pilus twitching motility protein PilT [Parcubacteria group bacterium]|nr:type IV pilus twitching motility protein PilT [Parcubacteria group bacterium]
MVFAHQELEDLLREVAQQNASDLHIVVGRYPTLRIDGSLSPLAQYQIVTPERADTLIQALMTDHQRELYERDNEVDFSYAYRDKARFRVNVYKQKGYAAAALRRIPAVIRTVEELNLPPIAHSFTQPSQGFFLVTGPAGHGKSTTLAALVDEINHQRAEHIITIEDPVEYLFIQDRCVISQREVHQDTHSFHRALRSLFREDADVAMIGEIRDPETIATAVTAAETGHLIFTTLHTNSAAQTIDRIIDSFPADQQGQIRAQLSNVIVGILSQRLIPRVNGGLVPAVEVMIANAAVRNLIRENKTHQLDLVIETNAEEGMITMNRSLADLVKQGEISVENAERYSLNPKELMMLLKR